MLVYPGSFFWALGDAPRRRGDEPIRRHSVHDGAKHSHRLRASRPNGVLEDGWSLESIA